MKELKNTKDKTDTHCLRRDSCREPTSIGCHRLSKSIATRSLFLSFSNIFNLVLLYSLFFPRSTNTSTQMPQISNPSQIVKAFSHPKLNPVTKTTQIQPKTEEGKVEIKAQREKGEANGYQWWWWRSSRVRPWLRRERESEIAERGSETELVVEGYKSGGCGGVFVSWIEA